MKKIKKSRTHGKTETQQRVHQNVVGLEVSVDDLLGVQVQHATGHLVQHLDDPRPGGGPHLGQEPKTAHGGQPGGGGRHGGIRLHGLDGLLAGEGGDG